ncbi:hotdog domain-containing protein [Psychrobacter coccoides]|nr:hotdog domain-containing protein [Psychrobacter coccoides]
MTTTTPNTMTSPLFSTDYHVYINHTDAGGIVYHANHLVFFENCRRDWFTKLGLSGYFMHSDTGQVQHFVVSQAQLKYKKAILLDETIDVRIDNVELKPASIVFYQSIHRRLPTDTDTNHPPLQHTLLSSGKIVIACVQNQIKPEPSSTDGFSTQAATAPMQPIRVPEALHNTIQQAITQHSHNSDLYSQS